MNQWAKRRVKAILQRSGAFPLARSFFRKVSPTHRRERRNNSWLYRQIVRKGDLCFDIGANLGQTIEALVGVGARVVALEPNPACFSTLRYHFSKNDNVTLIAKAVGRAPGFAELHFSGTDSTASIQPDWVATNDQRVRVELTTLDALIAQYGRPDFLKVDVEGLELEVFRGLGSPVPLIYFEMFGSRLDTVLEIIEALARLGEIAGINLVTGDNERWLIDRWVPRQRFLAALHHVPSRANVVVRMVC